VGCYIWYSDEETGRGRSPPRPFLAVPNVPAHPSAATVPITVPVLCCAVMIRPVTRCVRRWSQQHRFCNTSNLWPRLKHRVKRVIQRNQINWCIKYFGDLVPPHFTRPSRRSYYRSEVEDTTLSETPQHQAKIISLISTHLGNLIITESPITIFDSIDNQRFSFSGSS